MSLKLNPEIAAGFTEEAKSYFVTVRDALRRWAQGQPNALEEARRLVHTLKGASAMIGLPALAHVCLLMEESLQQCNTSSVQPADPRPGQLWQALQAIEQFSDGLVSGDRRHAELESAIKLLRRVRREPESGDGEAIRQILTSQSGPVLRTGPAAAFAASVGAPEAASEEPVSEDLLANFRHEAEENLLAIGRSLRLLESQRGDREVIRALRRGVHTLKGTAQSVGLRALAETTHRMEDLLDAAAEGALAVTDDTLQLLFKTFDLVTDLSTSDLPEAEVWERVNALREEYNAALGATTAVAEPAQSAAETEADYPEENVPAEFLEVFRPEAEEHLTLISTRLRDLQANAKDKHLLQDVRRAVHTLKGAAGVIGLASVGDLAHRMEDLLDAAWEGSFPLDESHQQLLFATADTLSDLITDASKRPQALRRQRQLLREYAAFAKAATPAPLTKAETTIAPAASSPVIDLAQLAAASLEAQGQASEGTSLANVSRFVRVPIERLDEMVRLVSELVVSRSTFEQHLERYRKDIQELRLSLGRLQRLSQRFDTDFEVHSLLGGASGRWNPGSTQGGTPNAPADKRAEFDMLEFDRYTDLTLIARDLSETASDISVGVSQLSHVAGDFDSYLNRLGRLTSDVQDRLMRMRMVPMSNLATRLHRVVRVTAERLGKQVDLILEGEQVEMDKTALEELAGPLEHLLRNAIDHGIESEAARRGSAKPVRGQVIVKAQYLGTQVVIDVRDDGAGVNAAAVRAKTIAAGLLTEAEAAALDDHEILDYIFRPGFSTAQSVSDISGRGVGLDVVRTALHKMKGTVNLVSRPGEGTSFQLRLPMSLAILRVLMVKVRGESYAVPLAAVTRILRLEPGQLERLGNQQILRLGQQAITAIRLDDALGVKAARAEELSADDLAAARPPVLVLDIGGQQAAIIVDELMVAREVVVKSLGSLVQRVRGVTGATILGDGSIVLIINATELFDAQRGSALASPARYGQTRRSRGVAQTGYDLLVVDDSVSVRRVLTNLFQNQGWRPTAAKDGLDALETLQSGKHFDAVLLDMEMPRMDGYELLALLRGQPQFASLPVVMLTSRAAEKHRRKAFELGATDFLVKPYQDENLIAVLHRVIRANREAVAG